MRIFGFIFLCYFAFVLGYDESDEGENRKIENRRFVPMYPYYEKLKKSQMNIPEDPSLIPMKATKELVEEVAARSKQLKEGRSPIILDEAEQQKLKHSGQYWDRFWTEPLKEGRRVNAEVSEARKLSATELASDLQATSTEYPVVPEVPQSVNFAKAEPDDIEVKTELPTLSTESAEESTSEIFFEIDSDQKSTAKVEEVTAATTIKPTKNDKKNKTKKTDLVISLPGAEVQGSVKAKLVPGTKLYKLMKNAQKKLGENYQPKLLYVVNNYQSQND